VLSIGTKIGDLGMVW